MVFFLRRHSRLLFLVFALFIFGLFLMFRAKGRKSVFKKPRVKPPLASILLKYVAPENGPYLDCHVSGGLGNQMLEMTSCAFLAILTNRKLVMRSDVRAANGKANLLGNTSSFLIVGVPTVVGEEWIENHLPPISMMIQSASETDLFLCDDLESLVGHDRIALRLPASGSCFFLVGQMLAVNRHFADKFREWFGGEPYSHLARFLFHPAKHLLRVIEGTFANEDDVTIGVHLRFGKGSRDLYWHLDDPISMARACIQCISKWLAAIPQDKIRIYLATDDLRIRDYFRLRFGDESLLGHALATPPDNDHHEMLVQDMFSLAKTTLFIGTYWSSVTTQVALQRSDAIGMFLLKNGSCVDFVNGDKMWSKDLTSMYPVISMNTSMCKASDIQQIFALD